MKNYKGYLVWTQWRTEDFGFRGVIMDMDRNFIHRTQAFFYEKNAMEYAELLVDLIVDHVAIVESSERENTNNWRRMHGLPMKRRY